MSTIKKKRVLQQLKADLIGKDSYRGVTLTYSWMANQMGHLSLGFVPTFILFSNIKGKAGYENPIVSALFVSGFWLLFELYNFLWPLLKRRFSSSKKEYVFKPKWANIAYDTFTDLCFFWLGAFSFSLFIEFSNVTLGIVIGLLLTLIFPIKYWFMTKMYQMYAHYPFQFRLSQWNYNITDLDKEKVSYFMKTKTKGNHLLIFGSQKSGKTSLGVAIANELSIQLQSCMYTSGIKLYPLFFDTQDEINETYQIWSWKNANYLVIDDVNPGEPIPNILVKPTTLLEFIDTFSKVNEKNRKLIREKNIIWILGNKTSEVIANRNTWTLMMKEIGIDTKNVGIINLS